jgi:hypothetical protein
VNETEITWQFLASGAGATLIAERLTWLLKGVCGLKDRAVQITALSAGVVITVLARLAMGSRTWEELVLAGVAGIINGCAAIGLNRLGADIER